MQVTLCEAVEQYKTELESLGRAEATVAVYMVYLRKFARVAGSSLLVASAITPSKMTEFFATIKTTPTRNGTLAALRGFTGWAVRMKYVRPDAAAEALGGRQTKAVQRQPKHYIPVTEFPGLLDCAGETHPIERAVIATALYTLCRQSEIIGLKLSDVNLETRELRVWRKKRQRFTILI
jgi:integrase